MLRKKGGSTQDQQLGNDTLPEYLGDVRLTEKFWKSLANQNPHVSGIIGNDRGESVPLDSEWEVTANRTMAGRLLSVTMEPTSAEEKARTRIGPNTRRG
jgi:hypothetical protein